MKTKRKRLCSGCLARIKKDPPSLRKPIHIFSEGIWSFKEASVSFSVARDAVSESFSERIKKKQHGKI